MEYLAYSYHTVTHHFKTNFRVRNGMRRVAKKSHHQLKRRFKEAGAATQSNQSLQSLHIQSEESKYVKSDVYAQSKFDPDRSEIMRRLI